MSKASLTFIPQIWRNFLANGALHRASALAFASLLALVPITTVGFVLLMYFPFMRQANEQVQNFIFNNIIASSGHVLEAYVKGFSQQASHMSWIGVAALIITVVMLMFSIEGTFNAIWKVHSRKRQGRFAWLRALFRLILLFVLLPALLGISLLLSSYLLTLTFVKDAVYSAGANNLILQWLPTVFIYLAIAAAYKFIPATRIRYRDAFFSALIATALFAMSKKLFFLYVQLFPTYKVLYGTFAAIPLFLIWIYVVWLIVILGAELCAYMGKSASRRASVKK